MLLRPELLETVDKLPGVAFLDAPQALVFGLALLGRSLKLAEGTTIAHCLL